ncbi:hypothetical protein [Rhodopirellula bahusiensis]|uniref:hypothetical protein n=2 Tax=Rhodopirellula bahusiensis TaxID=2014065 RepID=UPI003267CEC0
MSDAKKLRDALTKFRQSDDYAEFAERFNQRSAEIAGSFNGDDSWERLLMELARSTHTSVDDIEQWPIERLRGMLDALVRIKRENSETMTTAEVKKFLGGISDPTLMRVRRKAKVTTIKKGTYRRVDAEKMRAIYLAE